MNFDHTYLVLFGHLIFEPVTILTNAITTLLCIYAWLKLRHFKTNFIRTWAWFFLAIGISACFGSMAHGVQYRLGDLFLRAMVFMVNGISLISIYFCFKAANTYFSLNKRTPSRYTTWFVLAWIAVLLLFTLIKNDFLLIKIHAGIVLVYSLVVHILTWQKKDPGSGHIALGIIVSFISIFTHSMRITIDEWFNYKDISHVIMITSLALIYHGVHIKGKNYQDVQNAVPVNT